MSLKLMYCSGRPDTEYIILDHLNHYAGTVWRVLSNDTELPGYRYNITWTLCGPFACTNEPAVDHDDLCKKIDVMSKRYYANKNIQAAN